MPIQLTNQFRESVIGGDGSGVDLNYYPSITRDILKMNSLFINIPFKSDDGLSTDASDNDHSLLFDPNEVFNIISNNTTTDSNSLESLITSNEETRMKSPLSNVIDDGDTGTIKYKKIPTSETSNSIVSTNSESSTDTNHLNINKISNNIIEEANTLLSLYSDSEDTAMFDEMLTKLEISMEYEITQIHNCFINKKMPIINELERRLLDNENSAY